MFPAGLGPVNRRVLSFLKRFGRVSWVGFRENREENVIIYTVLLRDGTLLYLNMVVPAADLATYQDCFDIILKSIELRDQ